MAELIAFGVPRGFQTSKCDKKIADYLLDFYTPHKPGINFIVRRRADNSVHYIFLVYENLNRAFTDANGRDGSFFGMDIFFKNQYVTNSEKISKLFQLMYDNYVKGQIIEEFPNGVRHHKFADFVRGNDDFIGEYLVKAFNKTIKDHPELNFWQDVKTLPPLEQQTQRY